MSSRNREITFIVKMRNQARQAIQGLSGDLRKVAKEAATSSAGLKRASNALDEIKVSANQAHAAVSKLRGSIGGVVRPLGEGTKKAKTFSQALRGLIVDSLKYAAVAALIASPVMATNAILDMSADYRALYSRISLVSESQAEANKVMGEVYGIAQRNRTSLEGVGTLYYRTAAAVKLLGYSQRDVLRISEMVSQSMVVSGASVDEARGAMIQFSQAIAGNRLGGEELESVREQSPRLMRALIDGMNENFPELVDKYGQLLETNVNGVTERAKILGMGSIKEMAEAGAITTEVMMKALLSQADKLAVEFGKYPLLARDAANVVKNAMMKEMAQLDVMFGMNSGIAKVLMGMGTDVIPLISTALQPVADMIVGLAAVITAPFDAARAVLTALGVSAEQTGAALQMLVRGFSSALISGGALFAVVKGGPLLFAMLAKGASTAATAIRALTVAMVANPFLAIAVAVTTLVALFLTFQDTMIGVGKESFSVGSLIIETFRSVWNFLVNVFTAIWKVARPIFVAIGKVAVEAGKILAAGFVWYVNRVKKNLELIGKFYNAYIKPLFQALAKIPQWYANIVRAVYNSLGTFMRSKADEIGKFVGVFNKEWGDQIKAAGEAGAKGLEALGDGFANLVEAVPDMITGVVDAAVENVKPAIDAIGSAWGDAFSDQGDRMRTRDQRRNLQQQQVEDADIETGNGNRMLPAPEDKDGDDAAKKAAREREKRVKELTSAIKGLVSAYTPWLEQSLKDIEAHEQLASLNAARAQSADEFKDALDRANLSLAQYNQLVYAVGNDLKADAVKGFFASYMSGWEDVEKAQARLKDQDVVNAMLAAQAKGADEFAQYLASIGVSAEQAAQALARFKSGLTNDDIEEASSKMKAFIEANNPYAAMLNEQAREMETLAYLEKLRWSNADQFNEMLLKLGYTYDQFTEAVERATLVQQSQTDIWAAVKLAATDYTQSVKTSGMTMKEAFTNSFKSMEDALTNFITTGKMDFKGLVDSMLADLARLAAQQMVMKFAMSMFGVPVGHSGGIVSSKGPASRLADPAIFAGAKRFHVGGIVGSGGGLRPDEVPVIAKKDEAILPTARMSDGNLGVKALLPEGWDKASKGEGGGDDRRTITLSPTIHVTVEGGNKEEADETGQIVSKAVLQALKGMVKEVLVDERRPGGILNDA